MKRYKKKAKNEEGVKKILDGLTAKDLKDFVASEIKKDEIMRGRFLSHFGGVAGLSMRDFRKEINIAYQDVTPGFDLYPSEYVEAAGEIEKAGELTEAIKAYRGIADAIMDNVKVLDESEAFDMECFASAMQGMARCINQQKMTHLQKRRHILYMFKILGDHSDYYWEESCKAALENICTGKKDLKYWMGLLELAALANKGDKELEKEYGCVNNIPLMRDHILKKIGKESPVDI